MKSSLKKKKSLNYNELEAMGPIEKYEKFGKFPLKLVVSIFLVIFTTCQAVLIVAEANKYSRSQERFLYNMFIDASDKRSIDYNRKAYLYTVDEVKDHVRTSVNNFYGLKSKSLEIVKFLSTQPVVKMECEYIDSGRIKRLIQSEEAVHKTNSGEEKGNTFTTDSISNNLSINSLLEPKGIIKKRFDYAIDNSTLGPFDYPNEDIKEFLNDITEFRLNYTLQTYVPYYYNNNYDCNLWHVTQNYDFATRGHFVTRLNILRYACQDYTDGHSYVDLFVNKLLWIHVIVLILAVISLFQTWKYIQLIASMYMKVKSKHKQKLRGEDEEAYYTRSEDSIYYNPLLDEHLRRQVEEEHEKAEKAHRISNVSSPNNRNHNHHHLKPHRDIISDNDNRSEYNFKLNNKKKDKKKGPKFNKWYLISLIGNIVQIFGSAISIFDTNNIFPSTEVLVGFGCMLAFFNIGRYIEYSENYSTIYVTIKNSIPHVSRYLIGVTPIFLGFLFFGLCLFWRSERFTDTSNVLIILFSLAQGDSVFDTFKDLSGVYFFIGQIYLYLFCIIFIVVVLNIFIAIIEEVYITSKMENKTHWVFDYIQKDKKQIMQFKPPTEEMVQKITASEKASQKTAINRSKSFKLSSDKNMLDRRVSFLNDRNNSLNDRSLPDDSKHFESTFDDEKKYEIYQKKIDDEFNLIEEDLKAIMRISVDVKISYDEHLVDEMRILVLERINSSILMRTQELRTVVSKWA